MVLIDEGMTAVCQPVGAWQVVVDSTISHDAPAVSVEPMIPSGKYGTDCLSAPEGYRAMAVFGPGQNPLPWAEWIEELDGRRIAAWDVANWMPSKSPVFATAGETLWAEDGSPAGWIED